MCFAQLQLDRADQPATRLPYATHRSYGPELYPVNCSATTQTRLDARPHVPYIAPSTIIFAPAPLHNRPWSPRALAMQSHTAPCTSRLVHCPVPSSARRPSRRCSARRPSLDLFPPSRPHPSWPPTSRAPPGPASLARSLNLGLIDSTRQSQSPAWTRVPGLAALCARGSPRQISSQSADRRPNSSHSARSSSLTCLSRHQRRPHRCCFP